MDWQSTPSKVVQVTKTESSSGALIYFTLQSTPSLSSPLLPHSQPNSMLTVYVSSNLPRNSCFLIRRWVRFEWPSTNWKLMKHQQTSLQPVAEMLRHFDKKLTCVAGVGKGGEREFQAQEKRKGWGAQGGREENVYRETIVFTIQPTNNVYIRART